MRRLAAGLVRLIAALVLVAALVVLPLAVWRGVGGPGSIDWREALGSGRIDADTVVALGLIVFTALWVWFAATAVNEVLHVLSWRNRAEAVLAPIEPTPSGAIRRLVRIALISTSTVVGASLASIASLAVTGSPASARAGVMFAASTASTGVSALHATTIDPLAHSVQVRGDRIDMRSNGRDTPYSIAVRLGDPTLRDRIIELNRGEPMPDGGAWSSGVFPAGMAVRVPAGAHLPHATTWQPYTVVDGDSVYRIATRLAAGDNRRVRELADAIIDRNVGRSMIDGKVFDDPSLVRIGWVLDVPATVGDALGDGLHVVAPGESYWSIAERHTPAHDDDPSEVARLVDELQHLNADRLGHTPRAMLHPGDELRLPADVAVDPTLPPAAGATDATLPVVVVRPLGADVTVALPVVTEPGSDSTVPAPTPDPVPVVLALPDTTAPPAPAGPPAPLAESSTNLPVDASGSASQPHPSGPSGPAVVATAGETRSPVTTSLAAAVLLCAGALGLVESRRRHQLRRSGPLTQLPTPSDELVRIERLVRSLDATARAVRLDIALRSAGHLLVGTGGFVRAAIIDDDGTVTLLLDRPGRSPVSPWRASDRADRWVLDGATVNDEVAATARLAGQPCPATVHLGRLVLDEGVTAGGDLFIDLEAFGLVCIDEGGAGHGAESIVRAMASSLATSPMAETLRLITHGLDPAVHLGNLNAEAADDLEHALDLAAAALGATPTAIGGLRTSELRARGVGGEAWEPVVVVSTGADGLSDGLSDEAARELLDLTRAGGRSLAVVLGRPIDGASLTVRATTAGWELAPLGLTVVPVGVDPDQVRRVRRLLEAAEAPLPAASVDPVARDASVTPAPFEEAPWSLMIRVLGAVDVLAATGDRVSFDRGKSLELVAWLGQHRVGATRGGARTALWELEVRDATFSNVVSDARRSLARAVAPGEGVDWIGRTTTGQLPLHALVVTDADLLRARVDHARGLPGADAIRVLRPGVALIRDQPFAGTDYLWPAAEGVTSSLTLLAVTAAIELARHHLALGDVDGVFWATGQGLLALPGHEELIGLRMRAHARHGDLAGVRSEWEAYERAITADAWSDGEPSPKLLALRRELLNR